METEYRKIKQRQASRATLESIKRDQFLAFDTDNNHLIYCPDGVSYFDFYNSGEIDNKFITASSQFVSIYGASMNGPLNTPSLSAVSVSASFYGNLFGNSSSSNQADKLKNNQTFSITGDVVASGQTFNGTDGVTLNTTLPNITSAGTYTKTVVNSKGQVTSGGPLDSSDIPTLDASKITTGTLDVARIPVLPSQIQVTSTGDLTALTPSQTSAIGQGTVVTTVDGFRYVYSGSGSKTTSASYTVLADITPDWSTISNRPTNISTWTNDAGYLTNGTGDARYYTQTQSDSRYLKLATGGQLGGRLNLYKNGATSAARNTHGFGFADDYSGLVSFWGSEANAINALGTAGAGASDGPFVYGYNGVSLGYSSVGITNGDLVAALRTTGINVIVAGTITEGGSLLSAKYAQKTHTHLWADITDKPSTFTPAAHNQAWSTITGTPTTLAGYGIAASDSLFASINAGTATKLQTARTIAGVSFDGSANISIPYANLTGLPTLGSLAAKSSVTWTSDLTGVPTGLSQITNSTTNGNFRVGSTTFGNGWHGIEFSDVKNRCLLINNTTNSYCGIWSNSEGWIFGFDTFGSLAYGTVPWSKVTGIPSNFTPAAHNQAWSTITSTPTTLGGYGISDALPLSAGSGYKLTNYLYLADNVGIQSTMAGGSDFWKIFGSGASDIGRFVLNWGDNQDDCIVFRNTDWQGGDLDTAWANRSVWNFNVPISATSASFSEDVIVRGMRLSNYNAGNDYYGIWSTNVTQDINNWAFLINQANASTYMNARNSLELQIYNGSKRNTRLKIEDSTITASASFVGTTATFTGQINANDSYNGILFNGNGRIWRDTTFNINDQSKISIKIAGREQLGINSTSVFTSYKFSAKNVIANDYQALNTEIGSFQYLLGNRSGASELNGLVLGNGDAATYETYNWAIRSHWGLGLKSYDNVVRTVFDTRTGNIDTLGSINCVDVHASGILYGDTYTTTPVLYNNLRQSLPYTTTTSFTLVDSTRDFIRLIGSVIITIATEMSHSWVKYIYWNGTGTPQINPNGRNFMYDGINRFGLFNLTSNHCMIVCNGDKIVMRSL